jgi:NADH-quinone oxidoreductase subunit H
MSSIFICLFFGGGQVPNYFELLPLFFLDLFFYLKVIFIIFLFIFLRANLPRFRFDQLMVIG